jgi:recombination protein RecT
MSDTSVTKLDRQPPVVVFRARITQRQSELEAALEGTGISFNQFRRAAVTSAQQTPELLERVSFDSLWLALLKACRDGLLPDGVNGAVVPFKGSATWIPMYRGLITRFQRSGHFKWIGADFHRRDDKAWRVWTDETGAHFLHDKGPGQGEIVSTYAAATTLEGGFFIATVSPQDMARIRTESRASREDSPWNKWPEQMMLKTAIRRLTKMLPVPDSVNIDDDGNIPEDDDGEHHQEIESPKPRQRRTARALQDEFAGQRPATIEPPEEAHRDTVEEMAAHDETSDEKEPVTSEQYFEHAATAIAAFQNQRDAQLWFTSKAQVDLRKRLGIPVDDVIEFERRMLK